MVARAHAANAQDTDTFFRLLSKRAQQREALLLHERLQALRPNAVVVGTAAHLIFALLLEPPFKIDNWDAYAYLLKCASAQQKAAAEVAAPGAKAYGDGKRAGAPSSAAQAAKHSRVAAAVSAAALFVSCWSALEAEPSTLDQHFTICALSHTCRRHQKRQPANDKTPLQLQPTRCINNGRS